MPSWTDNSWNRLPFRARFGPPCGPRGARLAKILLMRITFLGHAGLFVETRHGSVLCDPWFNPAYFGSWFPFPRNDDLDRARFGRPDFLYLSHLHRDHFDPEFLARFLNFLGDPGEVAFYPDRVDKIS